MAAALSQRGLAEAGVTALVAFTVGGWASFTFAGTVNSIGEARRLPCTPRLDMRPQQRGYRHRAMNLHILHYAVRKNACGIALADIDRPPQTEDEWADALTIVRTLNKLTVRQLRRAWNELVATGRPLHLIAAVIVQADLPTATQFLTSDIPDEYLTGTV